MQSSSAVLSRCRTALLPFVLALGPMLHAQTPASCTFTIFQLDTSASNTSTSIGGINDFRTLVGSRFLGGGNVRGLIRFSGVESATSTRPMVATPDSPAGTTAVSVQAITSI